MAQISRALIQKLRYFRGNTAGLPTTLNGVQTQYRVLSSVSPICSNPAHKYSRDSVQDYKVKKKSTENKNYNVFKSVCVNTGNKGTFTEAEVLSTINKLLIVYKALKPNKNFESHLRSFVNSWDFFNFCDTLESQVDKFSLKTLLTLYDLEYFKVTQTSSLMIKISKLVLDKFHTASLYDKLIIYNSILEKPCKEMNRKNILDECEAYVKKSLVCDLQCRESLSKLDLMLSIERLPKHVKLILAEKLHDNILCGTIVKKVAVKSLQQLAFENDDLLPRQSWLTLIRFCLEVYPAFPLIEVVSYAYLTLLKKDTSYYNPELVQLMINKMCGATECSVQFLEKLCSVGYFSKELLEERKLFPLIKVSKNIYPTMQTLSFLAQASFHEVVTESTAQQLRNVLETKEIFDVILGLPNNSLLCMYLTYIGCDTRVLLSSIFKRANNEIEARDSNLLTLHHFAKAYFPGEYESLSEKTVNSLVKDEFKESSLQDPENSISKCFGSEDFVLRNCITSDKHCLHFVTVFQSDKKPMNLASYSKMSQPENFLNVDTIEKPQGSKMIAFILYPYNQPVKFLNLPSMTGSAKMYLKTFQNVSCDVVLLDKTFFSSSLEDKKKFLKSQIDEIFEKSGS